MANTVAEFSKRSLLSSRWSNEHHYVTSFMYEDERNHSASHWSCYFNWFLTDLFILSQDAMWVLIGKLIRSLSFSFYYCASGAENNLKEVCVSFCVISDHLDHTETTVHSFISCIIRHLLYDVLPHLKKVYYFSDTACSQNKDCKHFLDLYHHEEDFSVAVEWNFFATMVNDLGWDW
jgi:hypothetical protein